VAVGGIIWVMTRLVSPAVVVLLAVLASVAPASAKRGDGVPAWVDVRANQESVRLFGAHQPVVATFHIPYPRKVAVVVEFQNVVRCRTCSAPSNRALPHGRVVRFAFDRATRRMTGALRFCEVVGIKPPLSDCLRR
jgi:hypothetical protein